MKYSTYFNTIAKSIKENPEDWVAGVIDNRVYYLNNKRTDIELWVANGPTFFRTETMDPGMAILWVFVPWRVRLWLAALPLITKAESKAAEEYEKKCKDELNRLKK